jgi:excisionase family DNA binding protein
VKEKTLLDKPFTKRELAELMRVSPRYIEGEVSRGALRMRRLSPRAVRFMPSDVEAWLNSKATTPVEEVVQ